MPLEVLGDDNEVTEVASLPPSKEKKSLGVYFGPEGGSKERLKLICISFPSVCCLLQYDTLAGSRGGGV